MNIFQNDLIVSENRDPAVIVFWRMDSNAATRCQRISDYKKTDDWSE